ncbi:MAG: permease prefix domain 1-containing protein [Fimbriimonas sp.]
MDQIQRFGEKRLEREELTGLHQELAGHLDAAIQARMELGASPIEAEVAAVQAMGSPRRIVERLATVTQPSKKRWSVAYLLLAGLGAPIAFALSQIAMYSIVETQSPSINPFLWSYYAMLLCLGSLLVVGWRERKPAFATAILSFVPCTLIVAFAFAGVFFWQPATSMPADLSKEFGDLQTKVISGEAAKRAIETFEASAAEFERGESNRITVSDSLTTSMRDYDRREQGTAFIANYRAVKVPRLQQRVAELGPARQSLHAYVQANRLLVVGATIPPAINLTWQLCAIGFGLNLFGTALRFLWDKQVERLRRRMRPRT